MSIADEKSAPSRESSEYATTDIENTHTVAEQNAKAASIQADEVTENDLEKHLTRKSSKGPQKLEPETYPVTDLDNSLVGWDSQDDLTNPRNFPQRKKWFILGLISAITFLSPLASSIFAPAIPFANEEFKNTSQLLGAFSMSVFVLGFAVGPLFISPLSEIYGRAVVLNISNVVFCAFSLGCALAPNLAGLIVMRFLAGTGGSACLTIGTGVISDLFITQERGTAMATYSLGVLFGPVIGPIIGGFIAQRASWRWDFYVSFIAGCVLTVGLFLFNRETNPIVLLDWKTKRLGKELGRPELQNVLTHTTDAVARSPGTILKQGLVRPLKLLFCSPIVFFLSLYISFANGLLFLLFTTVTQVYIDTYGWQPEMCGLAYLGVGLGFFLAIIFVARTSDATIVRLAKANGGVFEPEMRLPTCVFFGVFMPASFFWYGWCTYYRTHWILPIIGLLPFGLGMMGVFVPIQTYIVDCFPQYAASAVAGLTCIRCLFGAVLPLAGPSMYQSLGLGWGNSLLGFVAVGMIPFPALIYKYGEVIRKKWPINI